uniref:SdhC n=1 Tax=Gracilaria vermiculophylla TaxID=2608709 RepID=A0A0F6N293_9FLOR|nr:SdhC [Gracilaria vermiculophylla]AHZ58208.1 SdhC [Gracilaria vermiculophylla]AHZ58233.1 SdhC [Gracilaria vermiculophylla]AXI97802.1 succinate dehydrogenase subunit 3 [Gracilaria vermiculophylla]WDZ68094.1 succinate dehydrogenase subunit 3 [Gracilaria vermiculophylla]
MYNRPISPHITIYSVQETSLSSIWHRISGLLLTSFLVFFIIYLQLIIHANYSKFLLNLEILTVFLSFSYKILYTFAILSFFYHALNGLKQLLWDLSFFINVKIIRSYLIIISFFICCIILRLIF